MTPRMIASAYITNTAPRWPRPRFERRCAVWSLPGEVKGSRPRRAREMETSVVSKIGTPRMSTGTSHVCGKSAPSGRIFSPSVAIRKPRSMAPPSPIKIFAGLKFQRRKPSAAPRVAAASVDTIVCPLAQAEHVIQNAERRSDPDDPKNSKAPVDDQSGKARNVLRKKLRANAGSNQKNGGKRHRDEKFYLVMQQTAIIKKADDGQQSGAGKDADNLLQRRVVPREHHAKNEA